MTSSTIVRPRDGNLAAAFQLAFLFALIKFCIHLGGNLWQAHLGWGLWRDEFYYLACGQHLAWGYVDHGPIVALQAWLSTHLFGRSLASIRLFVALAGAVRVLLTGLITFRLGGGRPAQILAMTGILVSPAYLGGDSVLNMGPFESVFWMGCILALLEAQSRLGLAPRRSTDASNTGFFSLHGRFSRPRNDLGGVEPSFFLRGRLSHSAGYLDQPLSSASLLAPWAAFGVCAGVGLLNKPSMTFFLAALGLALLTTRIGRIFVFRREALLGIALMVLLALPNLAWQIHNDWPTLEFLRRVREQGKNGVFDPIAFLNAPIAAFIPATFAIWLAGLVYLLRRTQTRYLGLTYLLFLAIMMAVTAKDYYTFPIYPLLFAAGGVAWERVFRSWRRIRIVAVSVSCLSLATMSFISLPTLIPILTPQSWLKYTAATRLYYPPTDLSKASALPVFFAERFGWQEEALELTRVAATLSPADRANVAILCDNYGEAGALQFYTPNLPPVLSGQNTYYLWGFGHTNGQVLLAITAKTPEELHRFYSDVSLVGNLDHNAYMMPFERQKQIYLLRGPHQDMATFWLALKSYI